MSAQVIPLPIPKPPRHACPHCAGTGRRMDLRVREDKSVIVAGYGDCERCIPTSKINSPRRAKK